jgi:four helix bundle protein
MATVRRFEDLEAWKTGRRLVGVVYGFSADGAFARDFALRDQIRRAAISVMSNVAEGFGSRTQALFIDLLGRARGSAAEVQSQAYAALDLGYIERAQFGEAYDLAGTASRQIFGLIRYLESRPNAARVREDALTYRLDDV